jgi:AcrR family transcriptional regulator
MVTHRTSSRPRPRRNSEATREHILESVGSLLARRGFVGFGVNAVAREARVDKVLIYRYFGGLPQLLEAYADRADFWPTAEQAAGAPSEATSRWTAAEWSVALLRGLLRELRARPTTQEVLRWELAVSNDLTEKLAEVRERRGIEMLGRIALDPKHRHQADIPAIAALLSAGIIYLVLRAKTVPAWLGVSLETEEGWTRIERAVETIVRRVLTQAGPKGGER